MRFGIIGPGDMTKYCKNAKLNKKKYAENVSMLARFLLGEIIITPDTGSVPEFFANEFKRHGKISVVAPLDDKEFGHDYVNKAIADRVINCGTWRNQPEVLCEHSDILIVIGWAGGVMAEMYYTKWFGKVKKIYVVQEMIDSKLPKSLNLAFKIVEYIKLKELLKKIKEDKW